MQLNLNQQSLCKLSILFTIVFVISLMSQSCSTETSTIKKEKMTDGKVTYTGCGAYVAKGVWKRFDCYNIGADRSLDPLTPVAGLHGAKYMWGGKLPALDMVTDQNYIYDTTSPVNVGCTTKIWRMVYIEWINLSSLYSGYIAPITKTVDWDMSNHNPCPKDYRLPTKAEWQGVIDNNDYIAFPDNTKSTWTDSPTNFSTGAMFGNSLLLPAAGRRGTSNGQLRRRGLNGFYWSSTADGNKAWNFSFGNGGAGVYNDSFRTNGFSVRCIAE